jgi:6-phosphofructokinase 1
MKHREIIENPSKTDFEISSLGEAKIPSPLSARRFTKDEQNVTIFSDVHEIKERLQQNKPLPSFEKAGPRSKIFHDPSWAKAAIVTCGGLCPGINDVIKALIQVLWFDYNLRNIKGIRYGYEGLIPSYKHEPLVLDPSVARNIHDQGGTILGSSRGAQDISTMVDTLERMDVNMLFCIGGDGTLRGAGEIAQEILTRGKKISVVGVPKTIDNDLSFVGRTFGFETAVYRTSDIIRTACAEARGAHRGIGLVKLMGRDSGFIAAYASLATSVVDFCLIPEIPIELEGEHGLLKAIERRLEGSQKSVVIVVSEGAGQNLFTNRELNLDASGNVLHKDIGEFLQEKIKSHFSKTKPVYLKYFDPSYLIRGVPAQGTDSIFCYQLAEYAVHAAIAGKTNMVVGKWNNHFTHVPIRLATLERQKVDPTKGIWKAVLGSTRQNDYFNINHST